MFTVDIKKMVPRYILRDKNGYAMAKAIEAALQTLNDAALAGLKCIADYDAMPEWRLDELAWEYDIIYDYNAEIATKRDWIANAVQFYALHGTPMGIVKYLEAVFDSIDVEEFWRYGADPYHYRVVVTGEWSDAADDWAKRAIAETQNVRSVMDNIIFNSGGVTVQLYTAAAVCGIDITDEIQMLE